jgi:hypothetical protein
LEITTLLVLLVTSGGDPIGLPRREQKQSGLPGLLLSSGASRRPPDGNVKLLFPLRHDQSISQWISATGAEAGPASLVYFPAVVPHKGRRLERQTSAASPALLEDRPMDFRDGGRSGVPGLLPSKGASWRPKRRQLQMATFYCLTGTAEGFPSLVSQKGQ